ncbi:chromosomal replication initiator protein DnaA [Patescibacteria group bacterium]
MDNYQIWQAVLGELELVVSKAKFNTWFRSTGIISNQDGEITIGVPHGFAKEWLENKLNKQIFSALQRVTENRLRRVSYEIGTVPQESMASLPLAKPVADKPAAPVHQVTEVDSQTNLNPRYSFDAFVVGSSNELAHAACLSVSRDPGKDYNPLFIYGGVGLGKTHLLHAIGNHIQGAYPEKTILYTNSERFTNDLVRAIKSNTVGKFKETFMEYDVLIIDDIQFLSGKDKTQEELFHIFNALYSVNKQTVFSSDRPPKAIPTIEDRLRSRFEGGMIVDISQPEYETRKAILDQKSKTKGYEISDEVFDYIASNIQHNMRELEGALNRVIAHSQLNDKQPDLEMTKSVLANIIANPKKKSVSLKQIVETVTNFYDLDDSDLRGTSRKKEIVNPRQVAMFLMREEISASFPSIGGELGGRDHTTAMHACDKIKGEVDKNEQLRQELDLIKQRLYMP